MLNIVSMTASRAKHYYQSENYYTQSDDVKNSLWKGKGAKKFNLSGHVDDNQVWKNLLDGKTPHGIQLRSAPPMYKDPKTGATKQREARAGVDATFTAPKSVSIQALLFDDRLIEAHIKAVNRALKILEERFALTRINKIRTKADNFIIAQFLHNSSRAGDPTLHTHNFIMNLVEGEDGKWRSSVNELLYNNKGLLNSIYLNELALEIQKLGYTLSNHDDGIGFELEGFTEEQLEVFSKRRKQAEAYMKKLKLEDTAENWQRAVLATRKNKEKNVDQAQLKREWLEEAKLSNVVEISSSSTPTQSPHNLEEIVYEAIRHCEERKSIFSLEELELWVTSSYGAATLEEIDAAIEATDLLRSDKTYATVRSLRRELDTVALAEGSYPAIGTLEIDNEKLNDSQRAAIELALKSEAQVMAWIGKAGVGKTFSLKELVNLAMAQGIEVTGMAPDASSSIVLGKEVGIETRTVTSHLYSESQPDTRKLWIIDEAGKLSADEAYKLLTKARDEGAQVLLVGDQKQLSAVNAGAPFKSLVESGIPVASLDKIMRQKNPLIAEAVRLTYWNLGGDAIELLNDNGRVHQERDKDLRSEAIANRYLGLSEEQREKTLLLAGTHREREAITFLVREGLKAKEIIAEEDSSLGILRSKDMTEEQKQHTRFYRPGDVLVPVKHHNCLRRSQRYYVAAIKGDEMTLVSDAGSVTLNMRSLSTPLKAEVFLPVQIDIAVGDKLKWRRNDYGRGRYNGREFTVRDIDGDEVFIEYENGKEDSFSLDEAQHLDHAIVGTVYSSQGKTADLVLVSFGADPTVNRESVLVALSRAKYNAEVWSSNIPELIERAEISNNQVNPSEILRGVKAPTPPPPAHLELEHWLDRVEGSGIDPEVAADNARSVWGEEVQRILLEHKLEGMGSGQLVTKSMRWWLDKYEQVAEGGVLNPGGVDPLQFPKVVEKEFCEVKPDKPRLDIKKTERKGKPSYKKYEAPVGLAKGITLPKYPDKFKRQVYGRYGLKVTPSLMKKEFWLVVSEHPEIDVILTEGKKKAEALVSCGYAAIALPSVTGGYVSRDKDDKLLPERKLHPELKVFTRQSRRFLMGFDKDTNLNTIRDVRRDMVRTGEALEATGSTVDVMHWRPLDGKGIDDVKVKQGISKVDDIIAHAAPLYLDAHKHYRNEYKKLKRYVINRYGKGRNPTPQQIDVAIAYHVPQQDRARVLHWSPEVQALKNSDKITAAKEYIFQIHKLTQNLEQKMMIQPQAQSIKVS